MKNFTHDKLRTQSMTSLLKEMGLNLDNTHLNCTGALLTFTSHSPDDLYNLASALLSLLQSHSNPGITHLTVADLIRGEIINSTCTNTNDKDACLALIDVLQKKLDYSMDEQQQSLEIPLPSPAYTPLFSQLKYKNLTIDGCTMKLSMHTLLNDYPNQLISVYGPRPFLVANANWLESKKIFYAEKQIGDEIEVTPYFFLPTTAYLPQFHFVLDTSSSMKCDDRLEKLKQSVLGFAKAIFAFLPQTAIHITQFNKNIISVGCYNQKDLEQLKVDVNQLSTKAKTNLYEATFRQLDFLQKSTNHNNVLLFTDGVNTIGNHEPLQNKINELSSGLLSVTARNKFYIISYKGSQPEIMHRVAQLFNSQVINTTHADFMEALSQEGKIEEWIVAREFFKIRLEVGGSAQTYVHTCDVAGQFTTLMPLKYKQGETARLTIRDGDDNILLDDTHSSAKQMIVTIDEIPETLVNVTPIAKEEPPMAIGHSLKHTLWSHAGKIAAGTTAVAAAIALLAMNS